MGGALSSTPTYDLKSKHVFLTGGANGIGLAMAKVLLQKGCKTTLVDVVDSSTAVAELDALIKSHSLPGKIFALEADVSKYDQVVIYPQTHTFAVVCTRTLSLLQTWKRTGMPDEGDLRASL